MKEILRFLKTFGFFRFSYCFWSCLAWLLISMGYAITALMPMVSIVWT